MQFYEKLGTYLLIDVLPQMLITQNDKVCGNVERKLGKNMILKDIFL